MQTILFISNNKPDEYPVIDKHYQWHGIHTNLTFEEFSEIYHDKKPYAIYTFGDQNIWKYLSVIFIFLISIDKPVITTILSSF